MSRNRSEAVARIIRKHYGLNRPVTADEVVAEIANIERKRAAGALDDFSEKLAAALEGVQQ